MANFLYDTFTDTALTAIASHAPNVGGTWTERDGTPVALVINDTGIGLRTNGSGNSFFYNTAAPARADYDVSISLSFLTSRSHDEAGVLFRVSGSAATAYVLKYSVDLGGWLWLYGIAGSYTQIGSTVTAAFPTGTHTLTIRGRGTGIEADVDGVKILGAVDSSITAAGFAGIYLQSGGGAMTSTTGIHILAVTGSDVVLAPPDSTGIVLSPGNQKIVAATSAGWINCTTTKFDFTGTSLALNYNVASFRGASVSSGNYPYLNYAIDGGAWTQTQFSNSADTNIMRLAFAIAAGTHTFEARYQANDESDTWTPVDQTVITSWMIDPGAVLSAPTGQAAAREFIAILFGDSITRGYDATNIALNSYGPLLAYALDLELGLVAKSGQGWCKTATDGSPAFPSTYGFYYNGAARVWPTGLKYVIVNMGTNDSASTDAAVTAAVTAWIAAVRAAVGTATRIIVCIPLSGTKKSAITAGVAAYQSASPSDKLTYIVDPSLRWPGSGLQFTVDGTHPLSDGHAMFAALLVDLIDSATSSFTDADRADLQSVLAQAEQLAFDGSGNIKSSPQTDVILGVSQPRYAPAKVSDILATPGQPIATDALGLVESTVAGDGLYAVSTNGGAGAAGAPVTIDGTDSTSDCLRVVDGAGAALAGAVIRVYLAGDATFSSAVASATTGADGRWAGCVYLGSGDYTFVISRPGEQSAAVAIAVP